MGQSIDEIHLTNADFHRLSDAVTAIGTPQFAQVISEICMRLCAAEAVYLSAFFHQSSPLALYTSHTSAQTSEALDIYTHVAYILDPFYQHFKANHEDEVVTFSDFVPDDFYHSDYYQQFYSHMGLSDECGVIVQVEPCAALFFSLGTMTPGRQVDASRLAVALPFIASLARRHWTALTPERPHGAARLAVHLEKLFERFGSTLLSPREAEIVRMILQGHSSKAIANTLGNSTNTVKVHRKRIFTKLGITSQGELLSLFISACSQVPASFEGDPLEFHQFHV